MLADLQGLVRYIELETAIVLGFCKRSLRQFAGMTMDFLVRAGSPLL